jgi:hypothetical protein
MARKTKSYGKTVGESFVQGVIIMLNIIALGSFFFVQVGSIFFIVPAFIIDAMYVLNHEQIGPRADAVQPSHHIMKMVLMVVLACLIVFSALFLFQLYKAD